MRVGLGFDSHRFDPSRPLVLGGVQIPDHPGLSGHSDGDAVCHAVIDALLGAAGLESIGERYPDSDPAFSGAESLELLDDTIRAVEGANYQVVNLDVTVVAETPRIAPHADAMAETLADRLHVSPGAVTVKGKTAEGMGWLGREEGLASLAVVLVDRIGDLDSLHASIRSGG